MRLKGIVRLLIPIAVWIVSTATLPQAGCNTCRPLDKEILYAPEEREIVLSTGTRLFRSGAAELRSIRVRANGAFVTILVQEQDERSVLLTKGSKSSKWEHLLADDPSMFNAFGEPLVQVPSQPHVIYESDGDQGLYLRSEDAGRTWKLPAHRIEGMTKEEFSRHVAGRLGYRVFFELAAVDPRDAFTLYASISVFPLAPALASSTDSSHVEGLPRENLFLPGIYVSRDGGESWRLFSTKLRRGTPLGISPSNPNVMFGDGQEGIIKSADGGAQWDLVGEQEKMIRPMRFLAGKRDGSVPARSIGLETKQILLNPDDEQNVYIVSNKGVYRTLDGGRTWCLLDLGFDVVDSVFSVGMDPSDSRRIYVATKYGLFQSDDQGCHFVLIYPS